MQITYVITKQRGLTGSKQTKRGRMSVPAMSPALFVVREIGMKNPGWTVHSWVPVDKPKRLGCDKK